MRKAVFALRLALLAGTVALSVFMLACVDREPEPPDRTSAAGSPRGAAPSPAARLRPWRLTQAAAPAREDAAAVTANGYAYVIGGKSGSGVVESTVYYAELRADGSTGRWVRTSPLPAPREDHNAVVAGRYLYVVGGGGPDDTVYFAELNANGTLGAWRSSPNGLPVALDDASTVVARGRIYVIGGLNGVIRDRVYQAKLNADGTTGRWSVELHKLPDGGRAEHTSFVYGRRIYVIGGGNPTPQAEVFYTPIDGRGGTGRWVTRRDRLPQPRLDHTTVVLKGNVYVVGGIDEDEDSQRTAWREASDGQ